MIRRIWPRPWLPTIVVAVAISFLARTGQSETRPGKSTQAAPKRVAWTTSRIKGTPEPPPPYVVERIFPKLRLEQPTTIIPVPGSDRMIVTQLESDIVSFQSRATVDSCESAIDMSQVHPEFFQTFGIAFHPKFPKTPWCYITYQLKEHGNNGTRLARFHVTRANPPKIDPKSELLMASWRNHGHRGGCLEFGPDGYLYVTIGDGSPPNPPDALMTGQDVSDLQSSILRLDVSGATKETPYRIPDDNPFVKLKGARGEVWAYGFRNPWKICFDPKSGSLWAGDVGWELMEMVYRVERGGNYGWSITEGGQPVHPTATRGPTPIRPPAVVHSHVEARSVTGGYFYYGDRLPQLDGAYLYGDYMTGKIWGLKHDGEKVTWRRELADTPLQIISFARQPSGEILVVGFDGTLHRLIPNPRTRSNVKFPRKLSETGLFSSTKDHQPAPGVIPYAINAHHWADHTLSERLLALPGKSQVGVFDEEHWEVGQLKGHVAFPQDAVLAKTVSLEMEAGKPETLRRIETQILHRDGDAWRAYNYVWNDDQSDAELQDNVGKDRVFVVKDANAPGGVRRQVWHHSSRNECLLCHIWRAGTVHGFKLEQLNRSIDGDPKANQLEALSRQGFFDEPLPKEVAKQPSPYDTTVDLDQRARAWLHLNCAHCHRRGGGGTAAFDIQQHLSFKDTSLVEARVTQGEFGIQKPRIIDPGHADRSLLYYRISTMGRGHMPKFGSTLADAAGIQLIRQWIESLPASKLPPKLRELQAANRRGIADLQAARDLNSAISQLLSTTSGALRLAAALNEQSLPDNVASVAVERGATHMESHICDLFERFLPPERRVPRLGTSFDAATLLEARGDPERGRRLFAQASGVTCRKCHTIDGQGGKIGPDLSGIGRQLRPAEILDNIVAPSKKIDPKYANWIVATTRGTIDSGLMIQQSPSQVVLRDADGKDKTFPREDIEFMKPQQKSIMPEMLFRDFTAEQAADLLAFLQSRKGDPSVGRKSHNIPHTSKPLRIDGRLDEPAWKSAPAVGPFEFPWWDEGNGPRQPTEAKLLWDEKYLYAAFRCADTDIQASRTERDSPVYRDDCVELFASPFIDNPRRYFNLEINALGARLDKFRPDGVRLDQPWNPDGILIATSHDGTPNDDSDVDKSWTVEVAFPYAALGKTLPRPPRPGDKWRLNVHRLENNMRVKSQWSPGDRNRPSFHTPEYFGVVTFVGPSKDERR